MNNEKKVFSGGENFNLTCYPIKGGWVGYKCYPKNPFKFPTRKIFAILGDSTELNRHIKACYPSLKEEPITKEGRR